MGKVTGSREMFGGVGTRDPMLREECDVLRGRVVCAQGNLLSLRPTGKPDARLSDIVALTVVGQREVLRALARAAAPESGVLFLRRGGRAGAGAAGGPVWPGLAAGAVN